MKDALKNADLTNFYQELKELYDEGNLRVHGHNYKMYTDEDNVIVFKWTDYKNIEYTIITISLENVAIWAFDVSKHRGKIKCPTRKWMSNQTGELHTNIFEVIRQIFYDKKHYGFWNLKWQYKRKGW